jgi:hypothetical protein
VAEVRQVVQATVVFEDHRQSGNPATSSAHGLSVFLPTAAQYRVIERDQADGVGNLYGNRYTDLAFVKAAPNWQSFVAQGRGQLTIGHGVFGGGLPVISEAVAST